MRVSTDEQTTALQRREPTAWAKRASHTIVKVYEDKGISGGWGRRDPRAVNDRSLRPRGTDVEREISALRRLQPVDAPHRIGGLIRLQTAVRVK